MHKFIILLAALAPAPAMAYELWCMPTQSCRGSVCEAETDEETSMRLTNPDGRKPMLRIYADDVPMKRTKKDGRKVWTGSNAFQVTFILSIDPKTLQFTLTNRLLAHEDLISTGTCKEE